MTVRTGIIIQARMGSTRLPGKVMMKIAGKPILAILIERLSKSKAASEIIVATTRNEADDIIVSCARGAGAAIYRGDENDVLARFYEAAKEFRIDVVIRITADCPLADPFLIDEMVCSFLSCKDIAYLSNTIARTYPRGFDAEVFNFKALEEAYRNARQEYEREHVTPYMYRYLPVKAYTCDDDASSFRVTIDTSDDFRHVSEIFKALGPIPFIRWRDVVELLRTRPDLVAINSHVKQKVAR